MIAVSNRSDYQLVPHEPAALNLSEESMKTHKVALAFLLAHVAIFSLAVLCLDHPDLTGGILNYKAYDAINLTISSVFFVYTCRYYNASPRETGRICGYEFFASVMPMQILVSFTAIF